MYDESSPYFWPLRSNVQSFGLRLAWASASTSACRYARKIAFTALSLRSAIDMGTCRFFGLNERDHDDVYHDRHEDRRLAILSRSGQPRVDHRAPDAAPTGSSPVIAARTRPARCAASAMRSGDVMNEMRKNPSPPLPKPEP